jgi:8-oxo-dGTP pyrophosphatase MutT (NUDIX family)
MLLYLSIALLITCAIIPSISPFVGANPIRSQLKQSSALFLVNRDGKVLLVHPSGYYNRNTPWMPPKEEIESGETPLAAAQRAVSEEVGLASGSYGIVVGLGSVTYKSKSKMVWCFAAPYSGNDDDIRLDWENDRYGWFTIDKARDMVKEEFGPVLANVVAAVQK